MNDNDHCCQGHNCTHYSTFQNLDELEFERGLWGAAVYGNIKRIRDLLSKPQTNVNAPDKFDYTALHYASRNNHLDVCDMLIDWGANVFAATRNDGATPAHRAAYCGHLDVLKALLCRGGTKLAEYEDNNGENCLQSAYRGKQHHIVNWLEENYPQLLTKLDERDQRDKSNST